MANYKETLHLPKTTFPMKANLTRKEPETLAQWEKIDAYTRMVESGGSSGRYVLHDGPPYANGHIHLGTTLNKVLKDIIVKSRNMMGYKAEYVPGWDCHGLPIEHKVEQELGGKSELSPLIVRQHCREYAAKFLDIQRGEFKRLGVFGVWDDPYITMKPAYEAATARALADFVAAGSVVRSKKPIYWCASCRTALAEAEVEYADHVSPSIFVRFPLPDEGIKKVFPQADPARTYVVIWTTTPWTIPNNMAVALHPEFDYVLVEHDGGFHILAESLAEECAKQFGWENVTTHGPVKGEVLERLVARHPFYDRESLLILGQHVTLEAGTGCVHTAPGNGADDYEVGLKYGLEVYSPMDDGGRFLKEAEVVAGLNVTEANPVVIETIDKNGNLLRQGKLSHSYPHCWRCKKPVIYRATTQWFISMEANGLREKALKEIESKVRWIPAWGRERIHNMIANRPDWCISRQRMWGVPIVALLCEDCDTAYNDSDWMYDVVDRFKTHERGCDYWFEAPLEEIVPEGLTCSKCGGNHWRKETDILDVWFDSGTSFTAVLKQRKECTYPADMYLEGSDQHRGWFHSSLLASVGTMGQAPYKAVLTHGYVVDGKGKKMSKSVGNVVAPQEIIDKYGAEILRMWVSSVDYRDDIRISDEILRRLVDAYRRIRNTCRFLLGNLHDFDPANAVAPEQMLPLDRFALETVCRSHQRILKAYEEYEFHKAFHTLHNQCTDLSALYLDALKDRLYASTADSLARRSAQTVLYRALLMLIRDMSPILSFTAEEVYSHLPESLRPQQDTVFAMELPFDTSPVQSEEERGWWEQLTAIRSEVTRAIEPLRQSGDVGHSLDTRITLYVSEELAENIKASGADLREAFIVSQVLTAPLAEAPVEALAEAQETENLAGLKIHVGRAVGAKCERCWMYNETLIASEDSEDGGGVCPRCTEVLGG
jgi:isoleucyl-tRNA synthetase